MKKTLLLTLALGLAGAPSIMAGTVDVYITGATAFRANVYSSCTKLFNPAPTSTMATLRMAAPIQVLVPRPPHGP